MKERVIVLILVLIQLRSQITAQPTIKIGPDAGISSLAHQKDAYLKKVGLISPYFGIVSEYKVSRHFVLSSGIHLDKSAYETTWREIIHAGHSPFPYVIARSKTSYSKLCMSFNTGVTTRIWNLQPVISVGYRPNLILNGKFIILEGTSAGYKETLHTQKFSHQVLVSLAFCPIRHFMLKTSFAKGGLIEELYELRQNELRQLRNDEFNFSVVYYFELKTNPD